MEKAPANPNSVVATYIRAVRKSLRLAQDEFGHLYHCSKGNVSAWENGRHEPTYAVLQNMAARSGIALPGNIKVTTSQSNTEPGPDIRGLVPLISWVQAGAWQEVIDTFQPGDAEDWIACPVSHGPRTFVLRVRGESMFNPHGRPSFLDGDLIFVDPDRPAEHGSFVVVRLDHEKESTFKKLVIEGDRKFLRALNPSWPEPMIQINGDATICGVVIFKGEKL